ncbi:uncharacterized protein LOC126803728 [Argentina anserina]|uniref:uncharacterized protein LOC126803728 n=1 Tax=Argentina anserina TaxID=57926 RepID=UPI002176311B|nr:uncharacterized protein LOC126803728 [Potentilla anserina]
MGNECSSWQTPPEDVMEKILQLVDFADQRMLGQVSKSWRSIVFQTFTRGARRHLPWLILPKSLNCKSNKYLSFLNFPDNKLSAGKITKLKLPKRLQGGCINGSCKGWLIIIKEKGLDSEMCLVNPISGVIHKLPPLRTIPYFKDFVKSRRWELLGANGFCNSVKMSTPDGYINSSSNFIIAAVFDDRNMLCLCRPGDENWSFFPVCDVICDILFSSSTLYALVWNEEKDGVVAPTYPLNFAHHDAGHLMLKLVYDKHQDTNDIIDDYHNDYKRASNAQIRQMLLESTSKEVMVVHQVFDYIIEKKVDGDEQINENGDEDGAGIGDFEGNNDDEGGGASDVEEVINDTTKNVRVRTSRFVFYKIDERNNNFDVMQSLGDQLLFCGDDGVFSLPAGNIKDVENDCIYFITNFCRMVDLEFGATTCMSDGYGIFYLNGQIIEGPYQGGEISLKYQGSWFTPSL